jgi:hypothetical protein
MQQLTDNKDSQRYARCIAVSKRVRWDIDADVIRGRHFDFGKKFLPDSLSRVQELVFLGEAGKRFLSQVQGRTYANIFGLVERFINAKIHELGHEYVLGDQVALEALIRFSDEELKHQELFRRIEKMAGEQMPDGYVFVPNPNEVARVVLGKSSWAVLGLTLHIELFTQSHYRQSIEPDPDLSGLWKDVFLFHWKEESQHAIMDEMEWRREDASLTPEQRDQAVDDLIDLVAAIDGILQGQSEHDAMYFIANSAQGFTREEANQIRAVLLKAYRWQYIVSGIQETRFLEVLTGLVSEEQGVRINDALAPIFNG